MKYHLRKLTTLLLLLILGVSYTHAYTVTIKAEKFGTVNPSGEQTIESNGSLDVTANPNEGYEFGSWGVTGGAAVSSITQATTTVTATADGTVTAYFKEKLYPITIQSNNTTYGRVSHPSTSVGQINASSEITATANPGYRFTGWEVIDGEENITILNPENTITRIKAKGEGTIQANFEATTDIDIYFRPNNYWKKGGNEKFAVKYQNNGDSEWKLMSQVPNNTDYYVVTIPGAATQLMFGRFASNGTQLYNRTDWIAIDKDKNLFDLRPHFQPLADWDTDDARFAAKFTQNNKSHWESMTDDDNDGIYECEWPKDFTSNAKADVIFYRMKLDPANENANIYIGAYGPNQTGGVENYDALYGFTGTADKNDSGAPKNLFKGGGNNAIPTASTHWETYMPPTYAVTLYKSKFGPYGFVYGGIQYFSPSLENDTTYFIPKGDTVTLFSTPYNEAYNGDIMIRQGDNRFEITPESGDPILEISSATILDDNYKTKGRHTVYLAMPQSNWYNQPGNNYLRAYHSRSQIQKDTAIVEMDLIGEATDKNGALNVYYRCEVPAGKNTIHFEKRANANSFASSDFKTISLVYDIPLSSINCYILGGMRVGDTHQYEGLWDDVPGFEGDCRLVYYTGKKDDKGGDITFPSDIIREGVTKQIVSLHIDPTENTAEQKLVLQQYHESNWKNIDSILIEEIPNIIFDSQDNGRGVWNFEVKPTETEKIICLERYTGDYYIRTNNAEGGWRNYTLSTNKMTRSSYEGSGYTHYFCRRIDIIQDSKDPGHNNNVKFIIANDHGAVISTELAEDDYTNTGGILPADANVRWTWDEKTNQVSRAYIKTEETNNLIANYTNSETLSAELKEQKNWIYEADIKSIKPGSKLQSIQALYKGRTQDFLKNAQDMILADGDNINTYTIRVIYDFKINKTMVMIIPDNEYDANVGIDVLLDRTNQDGATQVRSNITKETEGFNVYATLTLGKEHLEDLSKTEWERLYYWISFPFDVRLSDVFGFGDYGKHWIIEYYDGKGRAENGYYIDGPSYWRYVSDPTKTTLKANTGYVLALNMGITNMGIFNEDNDFVRLYFPSKDKITSIDGNMQEVTVTLEEYKCSIKEDNRKFYDSNWHMIGAPSYANQDLTLTQSDLFFYYTYNTADNTYQVTSAQGKDVEFKSLHSYMVQYAGNIDWKSSPLTPKSSIARKNADNKQDNYSLRLALMAGEKMADQTFVQLKAEGATADYDMNMDLTKLLSNGTNIYTLAGDDKIQLAGSVMPTEKANIPIGVKLSAAGEYTFCMPDGTDGISAILIDNETGTHTDLLLGNYTVNLHAGTYENRFFLAVDPDRVNTSLENINGEMGTNSETVQKYIIDGELIIRTTNGIYDARGNRL